MFRFLRSLRRTFLASGKVRKYIYYATGEIALVVIGILIALWVNNYNNDLQNNRKFEKIFHEVKSDLLQDIFKGEQAINYYKTQDSLIRLVVNNQVTREMFFEDPRLIDLIYYYRHFELVDNGYELLSFNLDLIPERYDEVMDHLHMIYKGFKPLFNSINQHMIDYTYGMLERWNVNHSYFTMTAEEKIEFFMNDDSFKNDCVLYTRHSNDSFLRNLHRYSYVARIAYFQLVELEEGSQFDMINEAATVFHSLDTIRLWSEPVIEEMSTIGQTESDYPLVKPIPDWTSLYIHNTLSENVILKYIDQSASSIKIKKNNTIYTYEKVGIIYEVLTESGKDIGLIKIPHSNSVLIIE